MCMISRELSCSTKRPGLSSHKGLLRASEWDETPSVRATNFILGFWSLEEYLLRARSNMSDVTHILQASRKRFPVSSLLARRVTLACLLSTLAAPAFAQTKLKLSTIKPGTERVQLINNGDFQFQGPLVGDDFPFPLGWSASVDMYASAGTNLVAVNGGVVARAQVNSHAPATGVSQTVRLEPATSYVFSAYM